MKHADFQDSNNFDPNGVGLKNGNFIGLPFNEENASLIFLPVPWEVTVSYAQGTASGPENIREASSQLDLFDLILDDAWKTGIFMPPSDSAWLRLNNELRQQAASYINFLENGGNTEKKTEFAAILEKINHSCFELKEWVRKKTGQYLDAGKQIGLVGGDHSTPLGYLEALAERHSSFGVLQIDAHMDLRPAYEGFTYSHASIFYNALKIEQLSNLVQVGIRDFCEEEFTIARDAGDRVQVFFAEEIRKKQFAGTSWDDLCRMIIGSLPQKVYISFDIDGLNPGLCPHTGTPVPGGLEFFEALFLIEQVVQSGREIIGFDLSEVGGIPHEFDGNVAARLLYRMGNLMAKSRLLQAPG